jgi:hypothetical protein
MAHIIIYIFHICPEFPKKSSNNLLLLPHHLSHHLQPCFPLNAPPSKQPIALTQKPPTQPQILVKETLDHPTIPSVPGLNSQHVPHQFPRFNLNPFPKAELLFFVDVLEKVPVGCEHSMDEDWAFTSTGESVEAEGQTAVKERELDVVRSSVAENKKKGEEGKEGQISPE